VKVNEIKTLQTEVALKAIRPVSGLGPQKEVAKIRTRITYITKGTWAVSNVVGALIPTSP